MLPQRSADVAEAAAAERGHEVVFLWWAGGGGGVRGFGFVIGGVGFRVLGFPSLGMYLGRLGLRALEV